METLDPMAIPGMTEPGEVASLLQLAQSADLREGGAIVEFGTFFGRSTCSILNGMIANTSRHPESILVAYDGFAFPKDGSYAPELTRQAKNGSKESLLKSEGDLLSFRAIYDHYMAEYDRAGLLQTIECRLEDSEWFGQTIRMMHVDSPKSYGDLKPVLFRFFPSLVEGANVIFQDFFFHWSGSLIAAVQLLSEAGLLKYKYSVASSLVTEVCQRPDLPRIMEIDLAMQHTDLSAVIDRTKAAVNEIKMDRAKLFRPRLDLAKVQYLWESGRHRDATDALVKGASENSPVARPLVNDFLEFLRAGFDFSKIGD